MTKELSARTDRRSHDRRQGGERQLAYRGVERRRGDRRLASAAAGLMVAACVATPRPVQAQVYSWRDANGTLVLSNKLASNTREFKVVAEAVSVPAVAKPAALAPPRVTPYDLFISEQAAVHGIRSDLVRGVIRAESNFNPRARSPKGAMGLMQLMPATASELGVLDPFNALDNIRGGVTYLHQLLKRYDNSETLALAAYNAGPAAVDRHGQRVPPFRETQQYVQRILGSTPSASKLAVRTATKVIYKTTHMIDGFIVPRYSSAKPASGPYEIVKAR